MWPPPTNATAAWAGLSWLCALLGPLQIREGMRDAALSDHVRRLSEFTEKLPADVKELLKQPECTSMTKSKIDRSLKKHFDMVLAKLKRIDRDTVMPTDKPSRLLTTAHGKFVANPATPNWIDSKSDESPRDNTDEEFWPLEVRVLMSIVFVGLSLMGIIGNLLVVIVVRKVPGMITPTNCYLTSLAVSDSLFFVAAAPTELSYLHVSSSKYVFGQVGCALFSYLPYLAINTSSLSITAFTIERFIGICYPLRARYICTVKRAKHIIFLIWTFCIIYNSPWLYLATLKQDAHGQVCGFKLERDSWAYKVMFLDDFAAFYLIPMILYLFMYGKIVFTLSRCGFQSPELFEYKDISPYLDKRGSLDPVGKPFVTKTASNDSPSVVRVERPLLGGTIHRKNSTRGKVQVVKMLALVVIIFAVCWLPYRVMVLHNSFVSDARWDSDWYIFFSKTLIFFNCFINPVLYNLMSSRFRGAFSRLLDERRCWPKRSSIKGRFPPLSIIIKKNIIENNDSETMRPRSTARTSCA